MGVRAMLRQWRDAFIVEDTSPSYSALDLLDGLGSADRVRGGEHLHLGRVDDRPGDRHRPRWADCRRSRFDRCGAGDGGARLGDLS